MNKDLFRSMQDQLTPGGEVVDKLKERLSAVPAKKRRPVAVYAAVAACAALTLLIYPVYRMARPADQPAGGSTALHSYVLTGGGGYQSQIAEEKGPVLAGGAEEGPDSGETVYSGALIGEADASDQAAANDAYQGLMSYFAANYGPDSYPDWYGGSYIQGSILLVNVVEAGVPAEYWMEAGGSRMVDKSFYLQVQEWAGSTAIGFGEVKYSYGWLRDLQERVCALPELDGLGSWGCGVFQAANQVHLDVPEVNDALLAALARLDPEDDAIRVQAGFYISAKDAVIDTLDGDPAGYGK